GVQCAYVYLPSFCSLQGILARPVSDNFLEWLAEVRGLKDSLWEGAVLQLSLTYSEKYNDVPPAVKFNTIPFHPNVEQYSGRPCIGFLDNPEEWKEKLTISNILLAIQVMLSNPITENAVNAEAAEMLKNNMPLYRQMVMQCVRNKTPPLFCIYVFRGIRRISFEDYHRTWSRIATSKARDHFKDSYPEFIGSYCGWKAKNEKGTEDWDEDT
uniref:Ubiquitin conjugating enzyme E2 U n=1 Tax=Apteryx owenii TaxID=8824 RepID=A0A8B9SA60_APTOW